jgi:hypothetical protein
MKFIQFTIINLLPILFASCVKTPTPPSEPQLPPITNIGANTFGCKVNGVVYKTLVQPGFLINEGVTFSFVPNREELKISAITKNPDGNFNIRIKLSSNLIGNHNANKIDPFDFTTTNLGLARANDTLPAIVDITNGNTDLIIGSKTGDILSGTFDIKLSDGSTIYHLTEGRFDIKIK